MRSFSITRRRNGTETKFYGKMPKARSVRLVAALPDMGQVGALVAQFLIEHLKLKPFGEIVSFDKPFVLCRDGLISEVPTTYKLCFSDKANLVVVTGDGQPSDTRELYDICNKVIEIASDIGKLERIYTCGGYHREEILGPAKVYGVSNMPELFRELDRLEIREIGSEVSSITWFNGVILGVAKRKNIEAIGLYGELTNPEQPQPDAAKAVLKALTALLSLPEIRAQKEAMT
jgi:uncharacterized protein